MEMEHARSHHRFQFGRTQMVLDIGQPDLGRDAHMPQHSGIDNGLVNAQAGAAEWNRTGL